MSCSSAMPYVDMVALTAGSCESKMAHGEYSSFPRVPSALQEHSMLPVSASVCVLSHSGRSNLLSHAALQDFHKCLS